MSPERGRALAEQPGPLSSDLCRRIREFSPNSTRPSSLSGSGFNWVVVKIMVPVWVP